MSPDAIRIGTRGSGLALWQATYAKSRLLELSPETTVEIVIIKTSGDLIQDRALLEVGGKGLFVKEIQVALLNGEVDLAVHSLKDYPAENPEDLLLACVPQRQDPRDALVLLEGHPESDLPAKPKVGTGSLRRHFQASAAFPSWDIQGLRGNVDTRLRKVDSGELDAVILAAAGLNRLGHGGRISRLFTRDEMVPAVGQGAIALEARRGHEPLLSLLGGMQDAKARQEIDAERRFLMGLGGSCTTPLGIHAEVSGERVLLRGFLSSVDGTSQIRDRVEGPARESLKLADEFLGRFWRAGAAQLMGRT